MKTFFKRLVNIIPPLLLAFLSLIQAGISYAQQTPFLHFTIEKGLPSNKIYAVFRDSKGYLWIGTDKGIARYNGIDFVIFTTSNGLVDNEVFSFTEDYQGRVWLSSFKGELSYYKDGVFHNAMNTPWLKLPPSSPAFFGHGRLEKDGTILYLSMDGGKLLSIKNESYRILDIARIGRREGGSKNPVMVRTLPKGSIQLYYEYRQYIVSRNADIIRQADYTPYKKFLYAFDSHCEYTIAKDGIYNLEGNRVAGINDLVLESSNKIIGIIGNDVWYGGVSGLFVNKDAFYLPGKHVNAIEQDAFKNSWIGTAEDGLFFMSRYFRGIKAYVDDRFTNSIFTARKIGNTVYFVDNLGSYYSFTNGQTKLLYQCEPYKIKSSRVILAKNAFSIMDDGSLLRLYTDNYMIYGANLNGRWTKHAFSVADPPFLHTIKDIIIVGDTVYASSISSLYRFSITAAKKGGMVPTIITEGKGAANDINDRIYDKGINPADSSLWYSKARQMLYVKHDKKGVIPAYKGITLRQFLFFGQYLVGYTSENRLMVSNSAKPNLATDMVKDQGCIWETIYPIDDHRAIISTNNTFRALTLHAVGADGRANFTIQNVENPFIPQQTDCVATGTDTCYFLKNGTVTSVATDILFEHPIPPFPVFNSLRTKRKSYVIQPEINISYEESKTVSIEIDNISFTSKALETQYSISKLEADNWNAISGAEIVLNTPSYGTYYIKLRSKTPSSNFSAPIVIKLTVGKPFWVQIWFIGLCLLAVVLLVYAILQIIVRRKVLKKQREHNADMKFQQSEYKALNALMNPHFIFNSLNNIQGLINKDEKLTANQYLVIFSNLIRQNMHNISQGFISLHKELVLVENYLELEKLRFKELMNYVITIDEEVETEDIMIPPLMIQPLVENAIKHGLLPKQSHDNLVEIKVYEMEDVLHVEIKDNGIGLTKSQEAKSRLHESFGLSNLQKRAEHLKRIRKEEISIEVKEMTDSDGNVTGTIALVKMKLE